MTKDELYEKYKDIKDPHVQSVTMKKELAIQVMEEGEEQERSFSAQISFMSKDYFRLRRLEKLLMRGLKAEDLNLLEKSKSDPAVLLFESELDISDQGKREIH